MCTCFSDEQVNHIRGQLRLIYEKSIKPLEEAYNFQNLGDDMITGMTNISTVANEMNRIMFCRVH